MKSLLLIALVLSVSCGRGKTGKNAPVVDVNPPVEVVPPTIDVPEDASISSEFVNIDASSVLPSLDFRLLTVTGKQPSSNAINCDGTLGNSGKVTGIDPNEVRVNGDEQNGTIEFGHLAYVNATNLACRAMSKEAYTYSITGDTLTLCNVNCINNVYPSCHANPCSTFTK